MKTCLISPLRDNHHYHSDILAFTPLFLRDLCNWVKEVLYRQWFKITSFSWTELYPSPTCTCRNSLRFQCPFFLHVSFLNCTGVCGKTRPLLGPAVLGRFSADPGLWHIQRASPLLPSYMFPLTGAPLSPPYTVNICKQTARFMAI